MMRRLLIVCIKAYQLLLSPYNITCCRFQPTCSEYAIEAIRCYGCIRGMRKAVLRFLKCRPLGRFGYDPVE